MWSLINLVKPLNVKSNKPTVVGDYINTMMTTFEFNFDVKELSFCHKLWFSNFNIVATQCHRPLIFQTMNASRSNNVSLKYQRFTS